MQAALMRRSTVLNLPVKLVFPAISFILFLLLFGFIYCLSFPPTTGTLGAVYKTFYGRNLQIYVIS